MEELVKDIPGYDGVYAVTSMGRVISYNRKKRGGNKPRFITLQPIEGIAMAKLYDKDGEFKCRAVHLLVAEAFLPEVPGTDCVRHINGDKLDNRVENLERYKVNRGNFSPEALERMRRNTPTPIWAIKAKMRPVRAYKDGKFVSRFESVVECSRYLKEIGESCDVGYLLRHRGKSKKGWTFTYK